MTTVPVTLSLILASVLVGAHPPGYVDPVALAAATTAAGWNCALPHRDHREAAKAAAGRIDGLGTGPGQNPAAEVTGKLTGADQVDGYQVPLRVGEVLGATVTGGAHRLEIYDPRGRLVEGSESDRSASYPASSPLPAGGNATVDHVAGMTGTHGVAVLRGSGPYLARLVVAPPPAAGPQRIVLELAGTTLDTRAFGTKPTVAQPSRLSPLRAFLSRWGLRDSDEPALARRITDTVVENLGARAGQVTLASVAPGPDARADDFGTAGVSRVVIGGTTAESGLDTVGISESVDPGNLAREETAVVLLDRLSGPADRPDSLNHYLTGGGDRGVAGAAVDKIAFIGRALGNIASHEAGHFLGSWHTDPSSGRHDLMAPGDLVGAFGYGPDQAGGTADDTGAKFDSDAFAPDEGFTGTEDTRNRTSVGLGGGGANPGAGRP
ncbi:MAG: hypothetical protein J2P19_14085 [Pseudonocardia sp.]|nr:hypothetical protein [Pseudonocardia sp.]